MVVRKMKKYTKQFSNLELFSLFTLAKSIRTESILTRFDGLNIPFNKSMQVFCRFNDFSITKVTFQTKNFSSHTTQKKAPRTTVADAFEKYLDFMLIRMFQKRFSMHPKLNDVHKNFMHHYHPVAGENRLWENAGEEQALGGEGKVERCWKLHFRKCTLCACAIARAVFCDDSQQQGI